MKVSDLTEHIIGKYILLICFLYLHWDRIGSVVISVLNSSAVDRGFMFRSGQTKGYLKLVCVASPLSTQH